MTEEQKKPASTEKQQATDDEMMNPLMQEVTPPPPKRHVTLVAPVAQEKHPEPVNKQQMNEMMQNFVKYKENYYRFKKGMERIEQSNTQLLKPVNKDKGPKKLMKMQDSAKIMENYDQFKKHMEWIKMHGINNFTVTNEFAEKMTEICEKMGALNALIPSSVHFQRAFQFFKPLNASIADKDLIQGRN